MAKEHVKCCIMRMTNVCECYKFIISQSSRCFTIEHAIVHSREMLSELNMEKAVSAVLGDVWL
jgi:hypothetical protein